jgi:hypothetical protein
VYGVEPVALHVDGRDMDEELMPLRYGMGLRSSCVELRRDIGTR